MHTDNSLLQCWKNLDHHDQLIMVDQLKGVRFLALVSVLLLLMRLYKWFELLRQKGFLSTSSLLYKYVAILIATI